MKTILCVEDGSVDLETLETEGLKDGKVLVYRQGSRPPYLIEIPDRVFDKVYIEMVQQLQDIAKFFQKICIDYNVGIYMKPHVLEKQANDMCFYIDQLLKKAGGENAKITF